MMSAAHPENNVYRLLRIARDLSVKEIADALQVTPAYIHAIEAGKREPSIKLIPQYAKVLGVDENTLFHFREPENQPGKFENFLLSILQMIAALDEKQ